MFIWKIAPALATGNTIIIKSAEPTPLSVLEVCDFAHQAGCLSGFSKTEGRAIANHMDVDKLAFLVPTAAGLSILQASASSNLKKFTFELSG